MKNFNIHNNKCLLLLYLLLKNSTLKNDGLIYYLSACFLLYSAGVSMLRPF